MLHARFRAALVVFSLLALGVAFAVWVPGGNPVSTQALQAYDPAIVPDGSSGAVIAWSQDRVVGSYVYCNHYAF